MLLRAVTARSRGARKVRMLTRRRLLAGSALVTLASALPTSALAQVGPPPPPPPVVKLNAVAYPGASIGATIVIAGMIYIVRGIIGTQVIAFLYRRQATLFEFLLWPFPTPKPGPAEQEYLELAYQLGELPRFREEMWFKATDGERIEWPQTTKEMKAAIAFYSRRY